MKVCTICQHSVAIPCEIDTGDCTVKRGGSWRPTGVNPNTLRKARFDAIDRGRAQEKQLRRERAAAH